METPNILHFAADKQFEYRTIKQYYDVYSDVKLEKPQDLTILVVCSHDEKHYSLKQLEDNGIEYVNGYFPYFDEWKNSNKLYYFREALKNINTKYTLVIDAFDTIICSFEGLIEKFEKQNNKILFNAAELFVENDTNVDYPTNFESLGNNRYLNSGCFIGYTDYLRQFFDFEYDTNIASDQMILNERLSQQPITFAEGEDINIDSNESIFSVRFIGAEKRIQEQTFVIRHGFNDVVKSFGVTLDESYLCVSIPSQSIDILTRLQIPSAYLEQIDKLKIGECVSPNTFETYFRVR